MRPLACLSSGRGVIRMVPGPCPVRIVFDGVLGANAVGLDDIEPSAPRSHDVQ